MIKRLIVSLAVLAAFLTASYAATKGDQQPFAKYGVVQCASDGGTTQIPLVGNQNAVAVRVFNTDGGTGATVYLGFDTSVTRITGMPLKDQEMLSIDLVALTQNASNTAPTQLDGGVTVNAGSVSPKLYCTVPANGAITDLHWMVVK